MTTNEHLEAIVKEIKSAEAFEERDFPDFQQEPPVHSVNLFPNLDIKKSTTVNLFSHYHTNIRVTNSRGLRELTRSDTGITIEKSGLFRVTFHNLVHRPVRECEAIVQLDTSRLTTKHAVAAHLPAGFYGELSFSCVIRLKALTEISVKVTPTEDITLGSHPALSRFSIEHLG